MSKSITDKTKAQQNLLAMSRQWWEAHRQTVYAKAALLTQSIGLMRLSWFFARKAGFFNKQRF